MLLAQNMSRPGRVVRADLLHHTVHTLNMFYFIKSLFHRGVRRNLYLYSGLSQHLDSSTFYNSYVLGASLR